MPEKTVWNLSRLSDCLEIGGNRCEYKGRKQGVAQGIIKIGREVDWSEDKILEKLQAELLISQEEAKHYFAKVPS